MAKAYWVAFYRSVDDTDALAQYSKLAGELLRAGGGRVLARGPAAVTLEGPVPNQRCVVIEFDSVAQAKAVYDSAAYQQAAALIHGRVERELRIVEGLPPA